MRAGMHFFHAPKFAGALLPAPDRMHLNASHWVACVCGSGREVLKAHCRSATATVMVFAGFGLVCGLVGAAVLWWYVSQPFTIYTASYQPHDLQSFQIETVSVNRFIIGLIIGGPCFGAAFGALSSVTGWNLVRRERTLDSD